LTFPDDLFILAFFQRGCGYFHGADLDFAVGIAVTVWNYHLITQEAELANHKSAIKRYRQSLDRRTRNRVVKTQVKNAVKGVNQAIEQNSEPEALRAALKAASAMLSRAGVKGTIHKRNAARKISRLTRRVNALNAAQ